MSVRARIEVVGALRVHGPRGVLADAAIGGRRARLLLTALALADGTVSGARLAELIWAEAPPPTWSAALRGVVHGIRTATAVVGLEAQGLVLTVPGGYRLAEAVDVDVLLAHAAVRQAEELMVTGRTAPTLDLVEPFLTWRGALLLEGEDAAWLTPQRDRIDTLGRRALDTTARAATALGDHTAAVEAARALVVAAPLAETGHRRLIEALGAAGDRAGAVAAFEACRSLLVEELGVDPAPETVALYLSVLDTPAPELQAPVPRATTSFVAREGERARLEVAVRGPGLVSVVGRGGVGKSRLTAEALLGLALPAGAVLWVRLESVGQDELVPASVALVLGLAPGEDPTGVIVAELSPRGPTVLVLDGCETVLDGVASLAAELLDHCPQLSIVVTCRRPLGLDGEQCIQVEPFPDGPDGPGGQGGAGGPASALLRDRIRAHGGAWEERTASTGPVHGLLLRCAGLPLAVELLAAQLASAAAGDLADQFDLATHGEDDPLRAVAVGSYALLSGEEAALFRRFAVLDGAVSLSLARDVLAGDDIPPLRVLRLLGQLSTLGLVQAERAGERGRWRQDDDLHRYAAELLTEAGEEDAALRRVARAVRAMLPDDARTPPGPYAARVTEHLACVRSLFVAATEGRGDVAACLDLAFRLHRYWAVTSVGEGCYWLRRLLEVGRPTEDPTADEVARGYATYALGYLEYWSGDSDRAAPHLADAAALLAGVDDSYEARALIFLGGLLDDTDRGAEAIATVRRALTIAERHGPQLQMPAVMGLGSVLSERGEGEAAEHAARAIELCRTAGIEQLTVALPTAAMICWQVGALDQARAHVAEAMPLHVGEARISRVVLLSAAAGLALADDDHGAAADLATRADEEGTMLGVERELPLARCLRARALIGLGRLDEAAEVTITALRAAGDLTYDFPLALALETAALVLDAAHGSRPGERAGQRAELVAAAVDVRRRGARAVPATLARPTLAQPAEDAAPARRQDVRAAAQVAVALLTDLG